MLDHSQKWCSGSTQLYHVNPGRGLDITNTEDESVDKPMGKIVEPSTG